MINNTTSVDCDYPSFCVLETRSTNIENAVTGKDSVTCKFDAVDIPHSSKYSFLDWLLQGKFQCISLSSCY